MAPVVDDATVQEHVDDVPVIFIQDSDDFVDRQLVVDEQITDRYLSLGFRVQTRGIGRK